MLPESFEVSIIIPVHNRIHELKRAVDSIIDQTYQNFEIIIVDDCSTTKINPELFKHIDNIKIINLQEKGNANIARNIGARESNGKYVAFLDSDDQWKKNHLQYNLDFIRTNHLDGVFGGIEIHKKNNVINTFARKINKNELFINYIFNGGICQTSTFILKKSCFKQVQFDESLERHQDWDFGIRFYSKYNFKPNDTNSVIVHWKNYGKHKINLIASKKFIAKNKSTISKKSSFYFHRNMFHLSQKLKHDEKTTNYYLEKALENIMELTKTDFMSLYNPTSIFQKIYYNLKYLFLKFIYRNKNKF